MLIKTLCLAENQNCLKDMQPTDPRKDKERIEETKGGLLLDSYKWILELPTLARSQQEPTPLDLRRSR